MLPCGFTGFCNRNIHGKSPLTRWRLDRAGVYLTNIGLAWGAYGLGVLAPGLPVLGAGLALVHLLNAAAHIAMALFSGKRNPGVVSAATLLIPCAIWVLWLCAPRMDCAQWVLALLFLPAALALVQMAIFTGSRLGANR